MSSSDEKKNDKSIKKEFDGGLRVEAKITEEPPDWITNLPWPKKRALAGFRLFLVYDIDDSGRPASAPYFVSSHYGPVSVPSLFMVGFLDMCQQRIALETDSISLASRLAKSIRDEEFEQNGQTDVNMFG